MMQRTITHPKGALALLLLALLVSSGAVWAQQPGPQDREEGRSDEPTGQNAGSGETGSDGTGSDDADTGDTGAESGDSVEIEAVAEAMLRTELQLQSMLDEVPEAARKNLRRAIAASREGRQKAMAALEKATESRPSAALSAEASAESKHDASIEDTDGNRVVSAQGVARANVAIEASSRRAEQALAKAMNRVEGEARESIRVAINQVRAGAERARTLLARVERPERPDRVETAASATATLDSVVRLPR